MPLLDAAGRPAERPKRRRPVPATGQSRSPRNGRSGSAAGSAAAAPAANSRSVDLQLLLGRLQLAGELRVQVAPPIDVADRARCVPAPRALRRACALLGRGAQRRRELTRALLAASRVSLSAPPASALCAATRSRSSLASAATVRDA